METKPVALVVTCWIEPGENNFVTKPLPVYDRDISPTLNVFISKDKKSMFNRVNCTFIEPLSSDDTDEDIYRHIIVSTKFIIGLFMHVLNRNLISIMSMGYEDFKYVKIHNSHLVTTRSDKYEYELSVTLDQDTMELYNTFRT